MEFVDHAVERVSSFGNLALEGGKPVPESGQFIDLSIGKLAQHRGRKLSLELSHQCLGVAVRGEILRGGEAARLTVNPRPTTRGAGQ